jgi:hypothetical protein
MIKPEPREYDWRVDAYESWLLALASVHERLVAAGAVKPRDDAADQAWFERVRVRDG